MRRGSTSIDLDLRDVDVPLVRLGHAQAEAAGRWFAALPEHERPEVLLSSPYIRARQTAEAICKAGGLAGGAKPTILDERLREREFGVFDGLTTLGINAQISRGGRAPRQDGQILPPRARRRELGRRHPAPALGAQHDQPAICRQARARRRHQVVVLCMRYILEELTEEQILAIDKQAEILNCGIAAYDFAPNEQALCVPKLACGTMARRWRSRARPRPPSPT